MDELVKVKCDITEDNKQGYYLTYKSGMKKDEVLFNESETKSKRNPAKPAGQSQILKED